jgi:hypothetical protein
MPWTWNGRACGRRAVLGRVDQSGLLPSFPQRDLAHNPHNPQKSRVPAFLRIVRFLRTGSGLLVAIRRGNPVSMGRLGRSRGPREHGGFPGLLRIVREERRPGSCDRPSTGRRVTSDVEVKPGDVVVATCVDPRPADRQRPLVRRRTSSRRPRAQSAQSAEIECPRISAYCAISADRVMAPGGDPSGQS